MSVIRSSDQVIALTGLYLCCDSLSWDSPTRGEKVETHMENLRATTLFLSAEEPSINYVN